MGWMVHGDDALDAAIRAVVPDIDPEWEVMIVRWGDDTTEVVDDAKKRAVAVIAIVESDEAEAQALVAGVCETMRWPASRQIVELKIRRAVAMARIPWLERLRLMVDDSVEMTDTSVHLLDVNPAFERITGYARGDVLGKTSAELFRSEKQDTTHYAPIDETLERGDVWRGQFTAKRQDGSISFQSVAIAAARDAAGRTVGHVALKRDTSRDNLAWSALESSEARTRVILERAAEAVFVHGFDGSIADANPAASALLGAEREVLLAMRVSDFDTGRTKDELGAFWREIGADPEELDAVWKRADGTTIDVALSIARTRISGSDLIVTVARDVTEEREAKRRLEALNEKLEQRVASRTQELRRALAQRAAFLDHLSDGVIAVDAHGHIEMWNPAFSRLLGKIDPDHLGRPILALHARLAEVVDLCLLKEERWTLDVHLPGGRIAEATATPIHVDDVTLTRVVVGAVILVRDVTDAKEVDRMKTDFIATVSHELRTPLTSVLGFAKLARTKLGDRVAPAVDPDAKKAQKALAQVSGNLEIIVREGIRLSELIDDVLDISKMEAGRIDWNPTDIDAAGLLDEAIEVTSGLFASNELSCVLEVEDDLPPIVGDRSRLLQVVINLVSNAVKFTPSGTITLAAARGAGHVRFSVTDTGVGIPADQRATIFEKFKQVRNTLIDKPRGTGLGLPICKHIVEHHEGRIWADEPPGGGSRFCFVIPSRAESTAGDAAKLLAERIHGAVERHEGRPAEVLVVDDDPSVRELLRQTLEEAGHHVRLAEDGVSAVEMIREQRPDLVVLDVLMPGLSGFDVAAMLRSDPKTESLPIVIHSVISDAERSERLAIDRQLTKPLDQEKLLRAIDELTGDDRSSYAWVVMKVDGEVAPEPH